MNTNHDSRAGKNEKDQRNDSPPQGSLPQSSDLEGFSISEFDDIREQGVTLDQIKAGEVKGILRDISLQVPPGTNQIPIELSAPVKIELEQRGLIDTMPESKYLESTERLKELPEASASYKSARENVQATGEQIAGLQDKLDSKWHRFWSFSWLGSDKLKNEQQELDGLNKKQVKQQETLQKTSAEFKDLTALNEHTSRFRRSTEGYLALTDRGTQLLKDLEHFASADTERLDQITAKVEACNDVKTSYQWFRENGKLYSSHHAPALTSVAMFSDQSFQQIADTYQEIRQSGLYSSHHAPSLTSIAIRNKRSVEEVTGIYNQLRESGNLYSSNHAPALANVVVTGGKAVEEVAQLYSEFRNTGVLYSSDEAPQLVALSVNSGKTVPEVLQIYKKIREAGFLYSSKHAPTLVAACLNTGKSPEEIAEIYKEVQGSGALYTSHHTPVLTLLTAATGKTVKEVLAYYKKIQDDCNLYSSKHVAALTATAIGVNASQDQSGFDMDSSSSLSSSSSYQSYSSSGGFDMGWAVAGDLMDNGSMDLSGGFVAGGLLGGMF